VETSCYVIIRLTHYLFRLHRIFSFSQWSNFTYDLDYNKISKLIARVTNVRLAERRVQSNRRSSSP
jgi:hypothetical protein